MSDQPGWLKVVATPIGNLGDLSERGESVLREATCIACEDTRVTGKLLAQRAIEPGGRLLSYREENEQSLASKLSNQIAAGARVALVADAGTPTLSDPGFRLVRECRRRGLPVSPIPGPSAALAALSVSGLPSDGFFFAGFLPAKSSARRRFFKTYSDFPYTLLLYESSHRIDKCLDDLIAIAGAERTICVARELTKLHETVVTGEAESVRGEIAKRSHKGEFTLAIAKSGFVL